MGSGSTEGYEQKLFLSSSGSLSDASSKLKSGSQLTRGPELVIYPSSDFRSNSSQPSSRKLYDSLSDDSDTSSSAEEAMRAASWENASKVSGMTESRLKTSEKSKLSSGVSPEELLNKFFGVRESLLDAARESLSTKLEFDREALLEFIGTLERTTNFRLKLDPRVPKFIQRCRTLVESTEDNNALFLGLQTLKDEAASSWFNWQVNQIERWFDGLLNQKPASGAALLNRLYRVERTMRLSWWQRFWMWLTGQQSKRRLLTDIINKIRQHLKGELSDKALLCVAKGKRWPKVYKRYLKSLKRARLQGEEISAEKSWPRFLGGFADEIVYGNDLSVQKWLESQFPVGITDSGVHSWLYDETFEIFQEGLRHMTQAEELTRPQHNVVLAAVRRLRLFKEKEFLTLIDGKIISPDELQDLIAAHFAGHPWQVPLSVLQTKLDHYITASIVQGHFAFQALLDMREGKSLISIGGCKVPSKVVLEDSACANSFCEAFLQGLDENDFEGIDELHEYIQRHGKAEWFVTAFQSSPKVHELFERKAKAAVAAHVQRGEFDVLKRYERLDFLNGVGLCIDKWVSEEVDAAVAMTQAKPKARRVLIEAVLDAEFDTLPHDDILKAHPAYEQYIAYGKALAKDPFEAGMSLEQVEGVRRYLSIEERLRLRQTLEEWRHRMTLTDVSQQAIDSFGALITESYNPLGKEAHQHFLEAYPELCALELEMSSLMESPLFKITQVKGHEGFVAKFEKVMDRFGKIFSPAEKRKTLWMRLLATSLANALAYDLLQCIASLKKIEDLEKSSGNRAFIELYLSSWNSAMSALANKMSGVHNSVHALANDPLAFDDFAKMAKLKQWSELAREDDSSNQYQLQSTFEPLFQCFNSRVLKLYSDVSYLVSDRAYPSLFVKYRRFKAHWKSWLGDIESAGKGDAMLSSVVSSLLAKPIQIGDINKGEGYFKFRLQGWLVAVDSSSSSSGVGKPDFDKIIQPLMKGIIGILREPELSPVEISNILAALASAIRTSGKGEICSGWIEKIAERLGKGKELARVSLGDEAKLRLLDMVFLKYYDEPSYMGSQGKWFQAFREAVLQEPWDQRLYDYYANHLDIGYTFNEISVIRLALRKFEMSDMLAVCESARDLHYLLHLMRVFAEKLPGELAGELDAKVTSAALTKYDREHFVPFYQKFLEMNQDAILAYLNQMDNPVKIENELAEIWDKLSVVCRHGTSSFKRKLIKAIRLVKRHLIAEPELWLVPTRFDFLVKMSQTEALLADSTGLDQEAQMAFERLQVFLDDGTEELSQVYWDIHVLAESKHNQKKCAFVEALFSRDVDSKVMVKVLDLFKAPSQQTSFLGTFFGGGDSGDKVQSYGESALIQLCQYYFKFWLSEVDLQKTYDELRPNNTISQKEHFYILSRVIKELERADRLSIDSIIKNKFWQNIMGQQDNSYGVAVYTYRGKLGLEGLNLAGTGKQRLQV